MLVVARVASSSTRAPERPLAIRSAAPDSAELLPETNQLWAERSSTSGSI
jgi:hypothetical protein